MEGLLTFFTVSTLVVLFLIGCYKYGMAKSLFFYSLATIGLALLVHFNCENWLVIGMCWSGYLAVIYVLYVVIIGGALSRLFD